MVVMDERNSWAGGYAFCWGRSLSSRARRRIETELRVTELVLRAYLVRSAASNIATVTVGIVNGAADSDESDDLTVSLAEIADHFDIRFRPAVDFTPSLVQNQNDGEC
jgi:hypothetical protein